MLFFTFAGKTRLLVKPILNQKGILTANTRYYTQSIVNTFTSRSHNCGELSKSNIGDKVQLKGWLQYQRMGYFLTLRDCYGNTQITLQTDKLKQFMENVSQESVIEIEGTVQARPKEQENLNMPTGEIEVVADRIQILNKCKSDLPFHIQNHHKVNEALRMKYRYLDIRNTEMQRNLRIRSQMVMKMREFLCNLHGFVEVETPTLFRKTPGGAREFIVPTHTEGKFFSLPQSPQQFKQLLMVGGIDRYVQIARCYRDEGAKPDRQPEFTQVDIEMSFVTQEDIKRLIEQLIIYSWPDDKGTVVGPFKCMTYDEAMTLYGVDKPDLRFDKISDVNHIFKDTEFPPFKSALAEEGGSVKAVVLKKLASRLSNKELDKLKEKAQDFFENSNTWFAVTKIKEDGSLAGALQNKLNLETERLKEIMGYEPDDVIILSAGIQYSPSEVIGKIRDDIKKLLSSKGTNIHGDQANTYHYLWVENFPLFLPADNEIGLESAHHPFTAPQDEDLDLLYKEPTKVRSQHYDLVLNGNEIGGGSIRIHNSQLQRYVLEQVLKEDTSQLNHLLEALDSGCPPHGGIALGLDRLLAIVCGSQSIRDVIAFPKASDGQDPMSRAPAEISDDDRKYYHLDSKR